MVDLGLSGSNFSELKARYGFVSVDNCPAAADYAGLLCCSAVDQTFKYRKFW